MSELERAWAFMDAAARRAAESVVPFAHGWASVHTRLHRVYDLNYLRVTEPGASAPELVAAAEAIQGPLGMRHRNVRLADAAEVDRVEPDFVSSGFTPQRLVVMALHRDPDRAVDTSEVEIADVRAMRPVWKAGIAGDPNIGGDPEVVEQLSTHKAEVTPAAVPTTHFAARADGKPVSYCELYSEDGVGQIESVMTEEAYRGRGLARAVVMRAIEQSAALGNDLTFLVAVADDWPRDLYRKLGFDEIGSYGTFLRNPR